MIVRVALGILITTLIITPITFFIWQANRAPQDADATLVLDGSLIVSRDGGVEWHAYAGSKGVPLAFFELKANDPDRLYVGTHGAGLWVLQSKDGALTRVEDPKGILHEDADILALAEGSEGRELYVTAFQERHGMLFRITEDLVEELYRTPIAGYGIYGVALDRGNPLHITIMVGDGTVLETRSGGESWEVISRTAEGIVRLLQHPDNPNIFWAIGNEGSLYVTHSGGRQWIQRLPIKIENREIKNITSLAYHPKRSSLLAATDYGLIETTDGTTWHIFQTPVPPGTISITAVAADPRFSGTFVMAAGGTLYRTDDGGITWQLIDVPGERAVTSVRIHPQHSLTLYVGF